MNSLTVNNRLPQLRGIPVTGTSSFRYERMVSGRWVPCNHSRAMAIVGIWRRKGKSLCENLTGDSKTTGEYPSTSSDGSPRLDALYTFAKGTIMSASALLSNSSVNLQS